MTVAVIITNRVAKMLEDRLEEMRHQIGWLYKEGFVNTLLLLALSDETLSRQAAYLSVRYFKGKGATEMENKERC